MPKKIARIFIILMLIALIAVLTACTINTSVKNPFENQENQSEISNPDKASVIKRTTDSLDNLKKHLDSEIIAETGYYMQFDMDFDADDGSHFTLKLKANMYTYPYYKTDNSGEVIYDEDGKPLVDEDKLAIHNEVIKQNDLVIEWYDGHTNKLLVGLYFDGKNASSSNPGNNLYLNLRGETKRMFPDFGDTVMYQQLIRLITSIDIDGILGGDEGTAESLKTLGDYLDLAVQDNFKQTQNGDTTSIFYNQINLDVIANSTTGGDGFTITKFIRDTFGPFGNKIDPLTDYYLGFKMSTLGGATVRTLTTDLRFLMEYEGGAEIATGFEIAATGTAFAKNQTIPFRTEAEFAYAPRVSTEIQISKLIDRAEYKKFMYGQYEYKGELYVPMMEQQGMESRMDAIVRTKLTSDVEKNDENRIQMEFTDKANGSRLLLGAYYCNERTYLNTTGLQDLYGGFKINEIGFPQAYIDGPNVAELLSELYKTIDEIITDYVDGFLGGGGSNTLFDEVLAKMTSGDETISIRIDLELIKIILRETQEGNPEYSTQDIIDILSDEIGYDLEEIAFMLGIPDAKRMLEKTWFDLTYNVVTSAITIEMSTNAFNENNVMLVFRLDLYPVKIGEAVTFPEGFDTWFDGYKELQEVKTVSASMSGTVKFANGAAVDISDLLGAMIGDRSGLNTQYFLPASSSLKFNFVFDQYVKFDQYEGDVYPGDIGGQIDGMRGRVGFKLEVYEERSSGAVIPLLNLYAKDVAFNTNCEEDKLGYVWVDIRATGFTKVKIREDVFLASLTDYMGGNSAAEEAMALSIPQIIGALLEDSNEINFLPDAIMFATSNKTIQKLFGVKAVHLAASVDVGLTPRVTGIAQLESEFADYTVGELSDMTGDDNFSAGVYEKNLHETIAVTFTDAEGRSWIEYLKVPYYRVPAPGELSDYDSEEDYNAAVAKYEAYLKDMHCLEVVDGKFMYYPATNGDFMGQFRSYTVEIRKTGGSSLTSVTSKVTELVTTDFIWEPLEEKPTTVLGQIRNGSVYVPAYFDLDWSTVTLDGLEKAQYTVTIGPGSIGEAKFSVFITVRNRRIVQESGAQSESATVFPAEGGANAAPVAAELTVDPYDYILWRGEYLLSGAALENAIGQYLNARTDLRSVVLHFGDGVSERVNLVWSFDAETSGGLNSERYITAEGGNALYAHAYFHNQLIALKIGVLKKEYDHVVFDGESEPDVYTVDVLNTASKTIPVRPTVYFKDGTSRKFPFDLEWAFPVADNVTLQGAEVIDGVESPFLGHIGNDNAAWLSVASRYGAGADWFRDVLVSISVKAPAKEIESVYEAEVGTETRYAKDLMIDGGEISGYWIVDPLKPASKYLPASLTAYFTSQDGDRTARRYGADVIRYESDLLSYAGDGRYLFTEAQGFDGAKVRLYAATGWISEEFSFDLIIAVLPEFNASNDTLYFFDQSGAEIDAKDISKDQTDVLIYNYALDPFDPLKLPERFAIRSQLDNRTFYLKSVGGGEKTAYSFTYDVKPETRGGNYALQYQYVISGDYRFAAYLKLNPDYAVSDIIKVVLGDGTTEIKGDAFGSGYRFDQFTLNAEGFVLDGEGNQIIVNGGSVTLSEYLKYLFTDVTVVLSGDTERRVTPEIAGFDRFDVQETLTEGGATYTASFSEIPELMNLKIVVSAAGVEQIVAGSAPSLTITPFTADGKEVYPDGYALFSQEFRIEYSGGKEPLLFRSNRWTVAQVTNLKGSLLTIGSEISVLSPEILRADRENESDETVILLYAFLPDSSRINLTVRIAPLDFQTFVSSENEALPIIAIRDGTRRYSAVEIENLYAKRSYFIDAETLLSYLPTTVKIGGTELRDIRWIADDALTENLKHLNYKSDLASGITEFVLSTAEAVFGSGENPFTVTLTLYIRFLPAVVNTATLAGDYGENTGIDVEKYDAGHKKITVRISPYDTPSGVNSFLFPSEYEVTFVNETGKSYRFPLRIYYDGKEFSELLYYDFDGAVSRAFASGDDKNKMRFVLDMGYGQTVSVEVVVYDQTIKLLTAGVSDLGFGKVTAGRYDLDSIDTSEGRLPTNFAIDPYGAKYVMPNGKQTFIPSYVLFNFTKSSDEAFRAEVRWSEYSAPYGGKNSETLTGVLSRENFTAQSVQIVYSVINRSAVQEKVQFKDETLADGDVAVSTEGVGRPTAHIKNPFTFRMATDLPKTVDKVEFASGDFGYDIPIYWEMTDKDIDYNGNNMSVKSVHYRLYDENGQQFTFYLRTDRWDYVSLERMVDGKWQEMSPIYFLISSVSGKSDISSFRIQFRVTDATGAEGVYNRAQIFYSETSDEALVEKLEPVLYFDQEAIALAKDRNSDVQGVFRLGAEGKLTYEVQKSMATAMYTSAQPSITDSYFYYKVQTADFFSEYVLIDPLNPVWPTELYAYVNWTKERVRLEIEREDDPFNINTLLYLNRGGGVIIGRSVYVSYYDEKSGETLRFKHKIDILFLDRTVAAPIVGTDGALPETATVAFKDAYLRNTYDGKVNPYSDMYPRVFETLNTALRIYGSAADLTEIKWNRKDDGTATSVSFRVGNRVIGSEETPCEILRAEVKA